MSTSPTVDHHNHHPHHHHHHQENPNKESSPAEPGLSPPILGGDPPGGVVTDNGGDVVALAAAYAGDDHHQHQPPQGQGHDSTHHPPHHPHHHHHHDDGGGDDDDDKADHPTSRRFFPRVKQLVNPEWEHFLQGVLHCVQAHQAHTVLKASGVEDNAWFQVFHAVYGGIAADSCSVPQGKNRYHKFKDKIVELWRYMAVTEAPEHDINGRLWKMGRSQWEMYKSLMVVAGKTPVEITLDAKGSPNKMPKKKAGKKGMSVGAALGSHARAMMYEAAPKRNYLPSPLHELHGIWKMSLKQNDMIELGFIRKDYHGGIRSFAEECQGGPDTASKLLWSLEGLNELREVEQEPEMKSLISDAYKQVLQRYLAALSRKRTATRKGNNTILSI